jgi:hypothetical protein
LDELGVNTAGVRDNAHSLSNRQPDPRMARRTRPSFFCEFLGFWGAAGGKKLDFRGWTFVFERKMRILGLASGHVVK